jgi:hypothetical protein
VPGDIRTAGIHTVISKPDETLVLLEGHNKIGYGKITWLRYN